MAELLEPPGADQGEPPVAEVDPQDDLGGLAQLIAARTRTVDRLRSLGVDPYPGRVPARTHTASSAAAAFETFEADGADSGPTDVRVHGRLVGAVRRMGGSAFVHLEDGSGRIQLHLRRDVLGEERFASALEEVDPGDFVTVTGAMFRTRAGEISLAVDSISLLSKSLLPLPEKWHGIKDPEVRSRQRYLDLLANPDVRRRFALRSRITSAMRQFLDERGFLEVETPVLQPIYGGGSARPFTTHYHALDQTMYLRIADELYLKRLLVGGYERVYEICKDFRNEGIDRTHLPEFTQMECYQAYADYTDMMTLTEELVSHLAKEVNDTTVVGVDGRRIDLAPPWRRLSVQAAILAATGIDLAACPDTDSLAAAIRDRQLTQADVAGTWAQRVDKLLQHYVEPTLIEPTFLMDYPVALSPLAKRSPDNPSVAERFEPFIAGMEIGNSFTELNDPIDQAERFEAAAADRAAGDDEAHPVDEDFLVAMRHGMPPMGGLGIGVDRLVMLLVGAQSIRDVVFFPPVRERS